MKKCSGCRTPNPDTAESCCICGRSPLSRKRYPGLSDPSIATLAPLAGGAAGASVALLLLFIGALLIIILPSLFISSPSKAAPVLLSAPQLCNLSSGKDLGMVHPQQSILSPITFRNCGNQPLIWHGQGNGSFTKSKGTLAPNGSEQIIFKTTVASFNQGFFFIPVTIIPNKGRSLQATITMTIVSQSTPIPTPTPTTPPLIPTPTTPPLTPTPTTPPLTPTPTTSISPFIPTPTPCTPSFDSSPLAFTGIQGQPDPIPQPIMINNPCGSVESWSATASTTDGTNWLFPDVKKGIVNAGDTYNLYITPTTPLAVQTYTGSITLTVGGASQIISVTFTVEPEFSASPLSFDVSGLSQPDPYCKQIIPPTPTPSPTPTPDPALPSHPQGGWALGSQDQYWLCTENLTLTQGAYPINWSGTIQGSSITFDSSNNPYRNIVTSTKDVLYGNKPVAVTFEIDQGCHDSNMITFTDASNPAISINIPITCQPVPPPPVTR